ncbi:amino acid ABC transporter permease [Oceanospirillum sediminis]|uniref:Putative glutamine transport system permease protein GlnP n=1 Tax=Oceanospirillum sediminis TaxID=2760088 RepID=A0A839ISD7_9GAMM|nr:amino acid ABC transporter permease [Oceanospirillum sediminis]MBB1487580.1 amino acid ABC transporter permease [Oceanospirillum sediminis]
MHTQPNKLLWHSAFVAILLALALAIQASSDRINYQWNWHRVTPYILNTEPTPIFAEQNGNIIENAQGQLLFESESGDQRLDLSQFEQVMVSEGDTIFEGDQVASQPQWQFGPIIQGLGVTIEISIYSLVFAIILGLAFGLMRVSHNIVLRNLAITYVEIIRGTPLLVQIFIIYFFVGTVLELERFTSGVIALAVFTGAYVAEITRGGIQSIPKGQMEAARSLGMTYLQAMYYVILPQAFKRVLPPLAGQFINLIKDSSLVSVIAITDLTKAGREVVSGSFAPFEVWFTVALLYLLLTGSLSWGVQRLEKRLAASD